MIQLVRWIPDYDNGGAANKLWTGFCNVHDGNEGNGQRRGAEARKDEAYETSIPYPMHSRQIADIQCRPIPDEERPLNEKLLKLESLKVTSNEKGTTTSIWQKATYSKAVFKMVFKYKPDEIPSEKNNWHLNDNPW